MKSTIKRKAGLHGQSHSKAPVWQPKLTRSAVLLGMLIMAGHSAVSLAAVNAPISGEVERIIVNVPLDTWSGGIMVVGGVNVIIPRNMVIDLPANRLTLQQFFVNAPSACAADLNGDGVPDQTGLAKADSCNSSFTGAAVTILANRSINGDIIAGEIMLEKATELVSGEVTFINYDDGYFRLDGDPLNPATTGAMIRVNDPEGRHTHQTGAGCAGSGPNCSADTRYGVDPDNYTFTASTGYPMCIPSTVARGPYDFDVNRDGDTSDPGESITAQDNGTGTIDALCPSTNRGVDPVGDSRLFAPVQIGDHVNADGNFETIGGVTFLSAHTVGVSAGLTTTDVLDTSGVAGVDGFSFQPDYIIFDEVGWDVPGYQNQRVRDLLIGFSTLGTPEVDIFGLYYDPANNAVEELVFATTVGCDLAAGLSSCTTQGIVGNTGIFKIVHDVDFVAGLPGVRQSPCQHLNAAYSNGGIPDAGGTLMLSDINDRCENASGTLTPASALTLEQEFEVLAPVTRDIIGRSRHQHALHSTVVTLDFHGTPSQNGQYLNPTGIGHPEFVEIDLNALQTPLIFVGEQWNMDRRLGPGGGCDGEASCDMTTAIADASMRLDPFPYSNLDPGTQAAVPVVDGYADQKGRPLSYWPLTPAQVMPWPLAEPGPQGITATMHAGLMCTILSGVDTDGDGVDDAIDNCTLVANADQRDTDLDDFGNICDADLDNSGLVNLTDFVIFRGVFGQTAAGVEPFTAADHADLNGDNIVNLTDFVIFRGMFGSTPGPSGLNP